MDPKMKIIIVVREPVKRTISDYTQVTTTLSLLKKIPKIVLIMIFWRFEVLRHKIINAIPIQNDNFT